MIFQDLQDFVTKEVRKKKRVKAAQKLAVGICVVATLGVAAGIIYALKLEKETRKNIKSKAVNTVETINDTVQKDADMVKDFSDDSAKVVSNVIEDANEKVEEVKKNINDGYNEVTIDI